MTLDKYFPSMLQLQKEEEEGQIRRLIRILEEKEHEK